MKHEGGGSGGGGGGGGGGGEGDDGAEGGNGSVSGVRGRPSASASEFALPTRGHGALPRGLGTGDEYSSHPTQSNRRRKRAARRERKVGQLPQRVCRATPARQGGG